MPNLIREVRTGGCMVLGALLVTLGLAGPVAGAHAAVTTDAGHVTVSAPGVRAIVERSPFRLRFASGAGAPVLSEVANLLPGPTVMAPTVDPVPPGTDLSPSGDLYAPLAFLVGQASVTQYDGLVWGGNPMSGTRSGIQYAARAVAAVARAGAGATLTVSTNDPTGRTLIVGIAPDGRGAMRVTVRANPAPGVAIMSDAFASPAGEAFYGFGGRHNALDQHGQVLTNWTEEENITGFGQAGTPSAVLFPNGPTAAYYPQAQFVSSAGYGFLLDQPDFSRFRMDSDQPGAWSVAANSPALDYVVVPGAARTSIARLTAVTGRQPAPPPWALGPMLDRLVKNVGETESDYTANVMADLVNIRRYRLPLTAYRLEGWGFASPDEDGLSLHPEIAFADQTRVIATLRARGIHVLAYLRPWITPGSAPDRAGLTVGDAGGRTYVTSSTTGTRIALLDFTNPAAVAFWKQEVAKLFGLGFDGFMQDFGEEVVSGMRFHDGETGATMHNRYVEEYMQATRQELTAYQKAHPKRWLWFFNRAGFTGSARYEAGNFPGDESTDWSQAAGLASSSEDMLSRAIGGAFGFGTDIGGYYDYTTPPTTKELFLRWAEWAALSPVFRLHGSGRAGTHTPWSYDHQTVDAYRALSQLHERAAPLILALWKRADATGVPPTRPLWLEFPRDPTAALARQEWTLGDDVLVAPVVTEGATSRSVYFPAGCWRDPRTGARKLGPRTATVQVPPTQLAYFLRCGTSPFAARLRR